MKLIEILNSAGTEQGPVALEHLDGQPRGQPRLPYPAHIPGTLRYRGMPGNTHPRKRCLISVSFSTSSLNGDAGQHAARDYESSDRIDMMHRNHSISPELGARNWR
jgi:hypothetical protein